MDLGAIYESYEEKDGRGQAAYDPTIMVRVLLYGYCIGSYGSRKILAKTYEDIAPGEAESVVDYSVTFAK